jgi:hypothetical protein
MTDEQEHQQERLEQHLEAMVTGPHIPLTSDVLDQISVGLGDVLDELHRRDGEDRERAGDGWNGRVGGYCPVQGFGTVDGHPWYFRARWDGWSFDVGPAGIGAGDWDLSDPVFRQAERYGDDFDASWMPFADAWLFIERSIALFRG